MKIDFNMLVRGIVYIAVAAALLLIAEMWFDVFTADVFFKVMATLGILGAVLVFLILVKRDFLESKRQKDEHFLD